MDTFRLKLEPTTVPEWDAEDELAGVLGDAFAAPDQAEIEAALDKVTLELPQSLNPRELLRYRSKQKTPLGVDSATDPARYDYYLIEVPLTMIVPRGQRLTRLRLRLDLQAEGMSPSDVVAHDLFPRTESDVETIFSGKASLDVSKALQFALLVSGPAGAAASPALGCLGLELALPFKWTSRTVTVQSSGPQANPVEWYVTDRAMENGFTATAIVRAPKHAKVAAVARLDGELVATGALGLFKAPFRWTRSHPYAIS
jgi:hypothetical protein